MEESVKMAGKPERTLYGAQSSGFVEYAPDPSVGFSTERAAIGAGFTASFNDDPQRWLMRHEHVGEPVRLSCGVTGEVLCQIGMS